jgi:hypothetical protein
MTIAGIYAVGLIPLGIVGAFTVAAIWIGIWAGGRG